MTVLCFPLATRIFQCPRPSFSSPIRPLKWHVLHRTHGTRQLQTIVYLQEIQGIARRKPAHESIIRGLHFTAAYFQASSGAVWRPALPPHIACGDPEKSAATAVSTAPNSQQTSTTSMTATIQRNTRLKRPYEGSFKGTSQVNDHGQTACRRAHVRSAPAWATRIRRSRLPAVLAGGCRPPVPRRQSAAAAAVRLGQEPPSGVENP